MYRSNNPAILQLLLSLTGSLSVAGVQSLVLSTISTCPDLLTPYLTSVSLTFDPRPNSKWVRNMEFLINVSTTVLCHDGKNSDHINVIFNDLFAHFKGKWVIKVSLSLLLCVMYCGVCVTRR